ncbi:hypothetical protein [Calidithermus chliarophilus]|uniref:hypothetical protein n=1 Tax=Calidithermus chliarophilus TaxID=52023 RepID=UPI0003F8CB21|nr:hypothetical protein [Calidithermus chliarophilus]
MDDYAALEEVLQGPAPEPRPLDPQATLEAAERYLQRLELPYPKARPRPGPDYAKALEELPQDITLATPQQLGQRMFHLAALLAFAHAEQGRLQVLVDGKELRLSQHRARLYLKLKAEEGRRLTEEGCKAEIAHDPTTRALEYELFEARAKLRLLASVSEGYRLEYQTLSREIARRGIDLERSL